MIKTEDLLKDFLRDFKNWMESGAKSPSDELIQSRQKLMSRIRKMEKDSAAMDVIRERNNDVTWIWRHDIGHLFRSVGTPMEENSTLADDPADAILGK